MERRKRFNRERERERERGRYWREKQMWERERDVGRRKRFNIDAGPVERKREREREGGRREKENRNVGSIGSIYIEREREERFKTCVRQKEMWEEERGYIVR